MKYLILVTVLLTGCADSDPNAWAARMQNINQALEQSQQQQNNQNTNQRTTTYCNQTVTGYTCNSYPH